VFNSYFSLWFIFKAIMRSFSLLQDAIVPYIPTLIDQLTQKLLLVSKVIHTDASNR
jgi:phage-related protein